MDIRLDGRTAVITGGSKGLGLAMAQRFAASGADVAILARTPETLAAAKQQIQAGAKGKVATVSADVSKLADIRRAYDQVMSELGKIDILVNNAGQATSGPSEEVTDEMWQADLDLKLFAQIRFARLVFPDEATPLGPDHQRPEHRRQGAGRQQRADLGQPCRANGVLQGTRGRGCPSQHSSSTHCMSGSSSATRSSAAIAARVPTCRSKISSRRPGGLCRWAAWAGPRNSPTSPVFWFRTPPLM